MKWRKRDEMEDGCNGEGRGMKWSVDIEEGCNGVGGGMKWRDDIEG